MVIYRGYETAPMHYAPAAQVAPTKTHYVQSALAVPKHGPAPVTTHSEPKGATMSRNSMSRKKRLTITAAVTAALLVAGGGAAFAYWTAYGSGTGTATTGTTTNFTITSLTSGASLTPGGLPQTITFVVTNPGTGKQMLSSITPTVTTATAPNAFPYGSCSAADYSFGAPSFLPGEISAGSTLTGTVTLSMIDSTTNQDDCKNLTIPVLITAG